MESDKEREDDGCSLIPCPGVFGHHHHPSSFIIYCRAPFAHFTQTSPIEKKKHGGKVRNGREGSGLLFLRNNQNERERILGASRVTHRVRDEGVGLLLVMAYCNTLVQWICVRLEIPVGLGYGYPRQIEQLILSMHTRWPETCKLMEPILDAQLGCPVVLANRDRSLSTSVPLLTAVSFRCDAYGAQANSRHVEPTIIVAIRFYDYVSADTETYVRNLPRSPTHKLCLLRPGNGSSSPSSHSPPPPTGSPDTLTIPPVPRSCTL